MPAAGALRVKPRVLRSWDPAILRCRFFVFVLLAVLFLASATTLRVWGRHWAAAAYRPLLMQTLATARTSQVYGPAEAALLKAVAATPAYARPVLDAVRDDLPVLPELVSLLLHELGEEAVGGEGAEEATTSAARALGNAAAVVEGGRVGHYLSASAKLALGNRDAAREAFTELVCDIEHTPDIAYKLGLMEELGGNPQEAQTWYARAVNASGSHADAAAAYLRLLSR